MTISAVVVVKNEQEMLRACLESIRWVDEILVIDNESTDDSVKVAKELGAQVISFEGQDYAAMRNLGMENSTGEWVLYVDSDERVLEDLREEIKEIIRSDSDKGAYAISRRNIIFGEEKRYGPFWPDWVIRLFKRSDFKTWVGSIHEYGTFKGKLGYTKNSLLHLTHRGVDQIVLKSLNWSNFDAKLRLEANHPKMSGWRFLRILFTELFYQGVVRRGFFSGAIGVMDSLLQTFSLIISYIRLWEMQRSKNLKEVYSEIDKKLIESGFKK